MSYTLQTGLYPNSSTVALMSAWASAMGAALISSGWTQTSDTGQVQWTGLSITGWSASLGVVTATYSSLTGNQLAVGRQIAFTATTYGGTYVITGVTAANSTSGTFTFTSANTPTGTGTATLLAAVPSSAYVYEIWQPADALQAGSTAFYLKLYFGYSTTQYGFGCAIGNGTSGAGALTGYYTSAFNEVAEANLTAIQDCIFSGDTNRFAMCLMRGSVGNAQAMNVERTHNSDGSDSSDGVTLWTAGQLSGSMMCQQTISFSSGLGFPNYQTKYFPNPDPYEGSGLTNCLGSTCGVSPFLPVYGKFGNPLLGVLGIRKPDSLPGCILTLTVYGVQHVYYVTDLGFTAAAQSPAYSYIGIRFD